MIKYECDMCHEIFDGEDITTYIIPYKHVKYETKQGVKIKMHGNELLEKKEGEIKFLNCTISPLPTHLCEDCAKKIADMMDVVVDK